MIKEFREFLLRGNLLDLAVAVVVGAAFTAVVTSLTADVITPLIKAIFGGSTQFANLHVTVNGSHIDYGGVLNALLNFVIVAAVLFFLVIKPVNSLMSKLGRTPAEDPVRECPECLSKVPDQATRCAYCTSALTPTAG
ncbi:MAG: large conductance mechanosensitive channel protein MscL [Acidimicrobiales bacterium]|jgi:large conductance mechanosensitive channel